MLQSGWSYIFDKMKRIGKVHECSFLVTADVVGLYSSKHTTKEGMLALKNQLEEQTSSNIPMIWLSWHNLFSKTFSLNLTTKLSSKSLVVLLELNLFLHTPTIIWIKLRQIFLKRNSFSHFYGWDILTISFLSGHLEKQNLKSL